MRKAWTAKDIEVLKAKYSDRYTHQLAAELGRSEAAVKDYAMKLGLHKAPGFRAAMTNPHRSNVRNPVGDLVRQGIPRDQFWRLIRSCLTGKTSYPVIKWAPKEVPAVGSWVEILKKAA